MKEVTYLNSNKDILNVFIAKQLKTAWKIVDNLCLFCGVKANGYCRINGGKFYRHLSNVEYFLTCG